MAIAKARVSGFSGQCSEFHSRNKEAVIQLPSPHAERIRLVLVQGYLRPGAAKRGNTSCSVRESWGSGV